MEPTHVTSSSHTLLKEFVRLQNNTRYRQKKQQLALEGPNLVYEALEAGLTPRAFFYTREYFEQQGIEWAERAMSPVKHVTLPERLFAKIAETETPQPIAAIFYFNRLIYHLNTEEVPKFSLILDRLQDPGNMGTVIRTAAAAGVETVYYTAGSVDPYNSKVLRATAGSIFNVKLYQVGNPLEMVRDLKQNGVQVIAASAVSGTEHWSAKYADRCSLIIGNESAGIDDKLISEADLLISIPIFGRVESLNAAVSAALIIYEIIRHRKSSSP